MFGDICGGLITLLLLRSLSSASFEFQEKYYSWVSFPNVQFIVGQYFIHEKSFFGTIKFIEIKLKGKSSVRMLEIRIKVTPDLTIFSCVAIQPNE